MAPRKKKPETEVTAITETSPKITSIKGFNSKLQCLGYQFEVGGTYEVGGTIIACSNGFHAIPDDEYPLHVFDYYPPAGARYAAVTQSGETDKGSDKLASAKITIDCEISLGDLTKRAIEWIVARCDKALSKYSEGDQSASTITGYRSASTITGYRSASTSTGDRSASTSTGDQSASTSTGYRSASIATGREGKVKGALGNALFAVERDEQWNIVSVACGIVGKDGIEANVFYIARAGKLIAE